MKFFNLLILSILLGMMSCHKDESFYDEITSSTFTAKIYEEITGTVIGYVYDENNQPVGGASVQIYSANTVTNELGVFILKDVKMDKQGTYIKVTKAGYILGSDRIYPDKAAAHSYIKLFSDRQDKSFQSSSGGTIELRGGGTITFPSNSIRKENGDDYNGLVTLTAQFINPKSEKIGDEMPGGLIGIDFKGSTVVLGTAGMFVVEMKGSDGSSLNLKNGSKASFKIPSKTESKLKSIALWSFNENEGVWKEEGIATLAGDSYVGEVSHFSFWNCDAPFPLIEVCGRVVDQDGVPVKSAEVQVMATIDSSNFGVSYGYTDENGSFCGKMPKGAILKITVNPAGCPPGASVSVTVGPFDNDVILDDIIITLPNVIVDGTIECNGTLVVDGYLILSQNENVVIVPVVNGIFSFNIKQYFCTTNDIQIIGVNVGDNKSSVPQDYDTNTSTYHLNVCNLICNLQGTFTGPCGPLTINVTGGSGNYAYLWSNGVALQTVPSDSLKNILYQVTVTDNELPGCNQIFSISISGIPQVHIQNYSCKSPYYFKLDGNNFNSILWSNGETTEFLSVEPITITTYSVTVTSSTGCTATASITIDPEESVYISSQPLSCNKNLYTLDGNFLSGSLNGVQQGYYKTLNGPADLVDLNVLETGYILYGAIFNSKCQDGFQIQLPNLELLKVHNLSDSITLIGNIIDYETDGSCFNCTEGNVAIYKENDLNTDLVTQNAAGLPPGIYYVVVPDAFTGCFVAHKKVKIL